AIAVLLESRERQQVFNNSVQTLGVARDNLQKMPSVLAVLEGTIAERLDKAFDARNGGFQFMRHIGHKVAANVFQVAQLRHVVQHDQDPYLPSLSIPQRRRCGLQKTLSGTT